MEKLLTRGITYQGLRELFNKNEGSIYKTIDKLPNNDFKKRLLKEASIYWAEILKADINDVYYGEVILRDKEELNHKYIIGNLLIPNDCKCNTDSLVGVVGIIQAYGTKRFPNLEFVSGQLICHDHKRNQHNPVVLPKLKSCKNIDLAWCNIQTLALVHGEDINLAHARIKDFNIKKAGNLYMPTAIVEDISSLEEVDVLNIADITSTKLKINPNLVINCGFDCVYNKAFINELMKHCSRHTKNC